MTFSCKFTLASIGLILAYQLLLPPIVGLADQGDYARLLGPLKLAPTVKSYYGFVNRTYTRDPSFQTPGWESFTSQYLFVLSAVALNKWISKDGMLDIRVLGTVHIVTFLVASLLLLRATRLLLEAGLHHLISTALIVIFCDVAYVSYFNSFFTEPASYLFLLLLLATWLENIVIERLDARRIALFGLFSLLFVTAKPQNCIVGLCLAVYILRWGYLPGTPRWTAPLWSLILIGASMAAYVYTPKPLKRAAAYNMIFVTIVPGSQNPTEDLHFFGLDPTLTKYSGTSAFSPNIMFWEPYFQEQFAIHVNHFKILSFYMAHPARFVNLIRGVLPRSTSLRAENSGNMEQSAGYRPMFRSKAFAAWSRFRGKSFARCATLLFVILFLSVPISFSMVVTVHKIRHKLLAECYCMLALMALISFFTTVLGDSLDMVKHFFIYNVLVDICMVFAIVSGVIWTRLPVQFLREHLKRARFPRSD